MADLIIHKPLSDDDIFRGESKTFSSFTSLSGTGLTWYAVERGTADWSSNSDDLKNLFKSFGLAREDENDWFRPGLMSDDWYNAKRMIVICMDESSVSSYIEGNTVRLNVPTGTGSGDYVTFYGSSFHGYSFNDGTNSFVAGQEYDDAVYGCATAYLYANTEGSQALPPATYPSGWHFPYSGSYDGDVNPNSAYTDSFLVSSTKRSVPHLRASHWPRSTDDGHDVPYGVAFLERGIFVIFDMYGRTDFIANIPAMYDGASNIWSANTVQFGAQTYTGGSWEANANVNNRQYVSFTGSYAADSASVSYRTVTKAYKMIYFCHAGQDEFNSTTNSTYNHQKGYFAPDEADSLYISEVALYGDNNDVLAYAKLSEPVEKSKLETLTFKVELEL